MNLNPETNQANVVSRAWIDTYEEVATKAQLVRDVLQKRNVKLGNGSALSQLLNQADILSREWTAQRVPAIRVLSEAAYVNRLADAITYLPDEPGIQEALRRMAGSVMQPDDRSNSQGKDALWEVVLLADLRKNGLAGTAAEPDIVVNFDKGDYPIACKKIWSENGVEKHVRKGAKQLEPFANGGIIALNLDDLTPAGHLIAQPDKMTAKKFLDDFNMDFINRHRNILQRAIMDGKCDGFVISTTAAAVLSNGEPAFNLVTQSSLWHLKEAPPDALERFLSFARAQNTGN
ncbi:MULTISPECIES: hypothetical protein [Paraburkholderia]|uniref:Restriction endonuclease n=1 Tax=Paraburkholderia nemoris TaxID=2793076 RepID=A0ABM8T6Y1_9BURK|nr:MULTISPECIES: hypothetical protein [Paraburkholderia]MBK5184376.1 hypothetical protein [Burkholderia sp. R-69749]MBK3816458.1 hypothetical protein [Paraburkholderia aspalathi]CAE6858105.1 hypothetical protein R75777_07897 [Paraburkholderia nemoris]CAE6862433.1 hypothetical protein R69776_08080 [Paraburkholderia nemoris]CAE6872271.1 hypothetical protein R69749_06310 [Paraburkholderia domus]